MARERKFRVTAGVSKCGGFRATPLVIGLLGGLARQRRKLDVDVLGERGGFELPVRNARADLSYTETCGAILLSTCSRPRGSRR
jgi:hypothetical protein